MLALASGMRLADRFTLRELVGAGGMSQVWRAEDGVLGRPVAVKVLMSGLAADPVLRSSTWTEARATARLTHPHITQIYDYGETTLPDGTALPYLVMELVDGQSLDDRLRSGPLPWQPATTVCAQVAAALAASHRIGVVHRDIKPGNVMLTGTGAKVLDFGIAALAGGQPAASSQPAAGGDRLVGTPAYAAPELLRPGPATPAGDVYALGALLYETLTGHPPVQAASWPEAAAAHRAGRPVPPPDAPGLPRQVRQLCMACLSGDPDQRPRAEEVAQGLADAAGQPPPGTTVLPTVVDPPAAPAARAVRAGYAVGSAPLPHASLPHAPTMIDSYASLNSYASLAAEPDPVPRRMAQPVLLGLIGAVVVLGLALAVVTVLLVARPTSHAAQPASAPATGTTPPATASTAPSPPAATTTTATTAQAVADTLDATIADAQAADRIDEDTADRLHDQVRDIRESRGQKKVREHARDLLETINQLLDDGKLDQQTADQLITLLQPLTDSDR